MFSRKKDRDRRSSSVASPPPLPAHGQRQPSQTSSIDGRPSLQGPRRSSTSVELSADADGTAGGSSSKRGRRGSFFGFGASAKGHDGAEQPAQHGSGIGGLLNRTTSRFSTHDAAAGGEVDDPQAVEAGRREAAQRLASNGTSRSSPLANANGSASSQQLPSPAPTPPAAAGPAPPGTGIDAQRSAAAAEGLRHAIHLLAAAQPDKVYRTSPPTVRSLQMYGLDGKHPKVGVPGSETNDWRETWLELRGVVLHSWDMKEVAEYNARGEDRHPTRTNITDAYVDIVPALPPTDFAKSQGDDRPHPFVFSVNSAGLNAVLFSCESEADRNEWVAAIRLAGWENSRLQEVYTGHLIRATLKAPLGPQLTPAAPTLAGWFDVRTFGSRSWTHLWVVLSIASPRQEAEDRLRAAKAAAIAAQAEADATSAVIGSAKSRKRLSNMFGGSKDAPPAPTPYHPPVPGDGSPTSAGGGLAAQQHQPQQLDPTLSNVPVVKASFYLTPPGTTSTATVAASSAASRRSSLSQAQQQPQLPTQPVLVISDLHQAYAVFPETPAAVDASGMFKLEGAMRGDAVGASGRKREEGWCLLIPGDKRGDEWVSGGKHEMIRWLTAFHDAFQLYGRPRHYSWDPRDPGSLFFGHPGGPSEPNVFLAKAPVRPDEIRTAQPSFVRGRLTAALADKMGVRLGAPPRGPASPGPATGARNISPQQLPPPLSQQRQPQQHQAQYQQPQLRQQEQQRSPPMNGGGSREMDRGPEHLSRISQSTDGGRSSTPGSQGHASRANGGGFQLPPLSFDGERPSSTELRSQPAQSQAAIAPPLEPIPSVAPDSADRTPRLPSAALNDDQASSQPPTTTHTARQQSISSLAPTETPSSAGNDPIVAGLLARRADKTTAATTPEYAYDYTPEARTPASEWSQSSAEPGTAASRQSTGGPPSLAVHETLREEPEEMSEPAPVRREAARAPSEEGIEDYLPAHLIETGLPVESAPLPAHPQVSQQTLSPIAASPPTAVRRKEMASLGRRPSGARAAPPRRVASGSTSSMPAFSDEEEQHPVEPANGARTPDQHTAAMEPASSPGGDSHAADALAALSFLETSASPEKSSMRDLPSAPQASSSEDRRLSLPRITTDFNGSAQAVAPVGQDARPQPPQFPSSFGPGKAAAERRAKLEAAERERQEALHKPGRGKGQPTFKKPPRAGGWQSSDEDDEEDENDDEEDEDGDRARNGAQPSQAQTLRPLPQNPSSGQLSLREQQPVRSPSQHDLQPRSEADAYANGHHFGSGGNQARPASNYVVNNGGHSLPQSTSRSTLHQVVQPQPRATGGMPHSRSTMWNTHLETPHGGQAAEQQDSGKFVTIEPAATLTKAFNPNGLLQAGLADRDERSAKRQEELARADGSSLVSVPAPPPPPQMGLLGAITGYEAQRSREGGVGAALTERDRERREADERARKADNLQRSQMEQISQHGYNGAYPYGQPPPQGMMPGMMPWGMGWGMPPAMSQYGGYGGQMDPQAQMMAQQAAQMAYQQAMMSYSQMGSQMGSQLGSHLGSPGMMPSPSMVWPGQAPTPFWGAMSPPAAPPMSPSPYLPAQPYAASRAGSVFSGGGGPESQGGQRRASPSAQQQQPQQPSRSSTPRSSSRANLTGQ